MIYYGIQEYSTTWDSGLDWAWRTLPFEKHPNLDTARKYFREVWIENPYLDFRIIKAFENDDGREVLLEILDFKKGQPDPWGYP